MPVEIQSLTDTRTNEVKKVVKKLSKHRTLGFRVEKLISTPNLKIKILERPRNHGMLGGGPGGTQMMPRAGGFGVSSDSREILIQYNLENAQQLARDKYGLSLTLKEFFAHEFGHAFYLAFENADASEEDPKSKRMAVMWENEIRHPSGRLRKKH